MKNGRIIARKVRAYFDSGAYTRLVELRRGQMRGAYARPYTIPNVYGDIALRLHQPHAGDRHARLRRHRAGLRDRMPNGQAGAPLVGMDPMEFRILNAYRDGDMKAHRREAKNCALIECVQVAAEKGQLAAARGIQAECRHSRTAARRMPAQPHSASRRTEFVRAARRRSRTASTQQRTSYERAPAARRAPGHAPPQPRSASSQRPPPPCATTRFARGAVRFFLSVRHKETLIMTKHRGRGVASINYPIGMNLGGDPSQALVHSNPSGKFTVSLSSIDLGQGMKSVTRQICAETLGVPVEDVYVDTADSDTGPHCMGSFASRGTHRVGNAVMAAAQARRARVMMEAAAEELEVDAADLETDGRGSIQVKGAPHRSISTKRRRNRRSVQAGQRRSPGAASSWYRCRMSIRRPARCRRPPATRMPVWSPKSKSTTRPAMSPMVRMDERLRNRGARSIPETRRATTRRRLLDGHEPHALRDAGTLLSGSAVTDRATSTNI
jgi:CO/xanthine dehydrogenase Mo-binding subunit